MELRTVYVRSLDSFNRIATSETGTRETVVNQFQKGCVFERSGNAFLVVELLINCSNVIRSRLPDSK